MRSFELSLFVPVSRFRLEVDFEEETVVDVDSALLVTTRLVRLAFDDKDETLAVRGRLSIEDCDEAINYQTTVYDSRQCKSCLIYFSVVSDDSDADCLQSSSSTLERPSISSLYRNTLSAVQQRRFAVVALQ